MKFNIKYLARIYIFKYLYFMQMWNCKSRGFQFASIFEMVSWFNLKGLSDTCIDISPVKNGNCHIRYVWPLHCKSIQFRNTEPVSKNVKKHTHFRELCTVDKAVKITHFRGLCRVHIMDYSHCSWMALSTWLSLCEKNPPVTSGLQRAVIWSFDGFFLY